VVAGDIPAGRAVRLAGARHLADLETGHTRGLRFNAGLAQAWIDFFPTMLKFREGAHAGQPFQLQPWQQFIVGSLFGWLGADGFRRFRTAYIEAGKGNGKTPQLAGLAIGGIMFDDEPGAQVFCAAVTREQAHIMFDDVKSMVATSPDLAAQLDVTEHNIAHLASGSFIRPVSSEGRSLDAKRVHMALIDEIHEHPTEIVVNKLRLGTKGRRQALILEITNSGFDRHSICYQHHDYSLKVLDGVMENDAWFAYVCQLDVCDVHRAEGKPSPVDGCAACDDWTDERTWIKANPNLDVSITRRYLRETVAEALGMPAAQNITKRLNFCIWTENVTRWISIDDWLACAGPVTLASLRGRRCIAGLDLSSTSDLSALVLVTLDEPREVFTHFWIPGDNILQRVTRDRVPYDRWRDAGHLTATRGNAIDHDAIVDYITALVDTHGVELVEIPLDPSNASAVMTRLTAAGLTPVPIRQSFENMSPAAKAVEAMVAAKRFRHDGNPVMAWCVRNAVIEHGRQEMIRPIKDTRTERVDGIVALVIAMTRVIVQPEGGSIYEHQGLASV
jgi:phage terminase large subunit-like protein